MITRIEALGFRCLKYVCQDLDAFHVLVGPNASGKTTFLDVVAFLGQLVSDGLDAAIDQRTQNFRDLTWRGEGDSFELAVQARIPPERRPRIPGRDFSTVRYEVRIGPDLEHGTIALQSERVVLRELTATQLPIIRTRFPVSPVAPASILNGKGANADGTRTTVDKVFKGNDNFYTETEKGLAPSFRLGPRKSALANLPDDESQFPASTWLKKMLTSGVQTFVLNSLALRHPSPPGRGRGFRTDGSNLPWMVEDLKKRDPLRFERWIAHVQTAFPDLESIRTVERPEDRHRYLMLQYRHGLEIPSWVASDGTLRLLALTLPAYLPDFSGIYLIEEPENGIHPKAVETVFQSLSSVYNAQILMATHSPVILSIAEPNQVLCFAKTEEGATDIVRGSQHPALREWRGETNLGTLFAGGVLG